MMDVYVKGTFKRNICFTNYDKIRISTENLLPCSVGTGRTGGIGSQNYYEGRNRTGTSSQRAQ